MEKGGEKREDSKHVKETKTFIKKGDEQSRKTLKTKERKWRQFVFVQAGITVLLLIALLVLTIFWRHARLQSLSPRQHTVCVPCANIEETETDNFQKSFDKELNVPHCCGDASRVIDTLVKKFAKERFRDDAPSWLLSMDPSECTNKTQTKPAASIFGISEHMHPNKDNMIHWNYKHPRSFHRQIHYSNGFLVVKKPGFYYIHSQIRLNTTVSKIDANAAYVSSEILPGFVPESDTIHRHYVNLLNQEGNPERKILESSKSLCDISGQGEITSAIGAVFELKENDKVFVRTSHPQNLVSCEYSNHFSMYMI